jgi:N-glycosylase/DNA lyase
VLSQVPGCGIIRKIYNLQFACYLMALVQRIQELRKTPIKDIIDKRLKEFEDIGKSDDKKIFSELCFCILTANSTAENCIRVQKETEKFFDLLSEKELAEELKKSGCRFHTKRAGYIYEARKDIDGLKKQLGKEEREIRNWIADNIKGLGMKESSHFLRNIGYKNTAIIDFHILDILEKEGIIKKPKKLDKKIYLEIEKELKNLASCLNINLAELDLYLWYIETGKVLK